MKPIVELNRCPEGRGTFIGVDGKELAIFRVSGSPEVVVIDNACPHANGNLSSGEVVGRTVSCPWHQWVFNLDTGLCVDSPGARVARYPVEVRDGVIHVDLDHPPAD